jgi:2,4-dienoyl-CoA reductase-like NADH-dependent reductase (Old Yellow Enzyme family)
VDRSHYKIFSEGAIGGMTIPNRLVRSATWDPSILGPRHVTNDVLDLYHDLALGGIGMIITGGLPVYRERFPEESASPPVLPYSDLRIRGLEEMAQIVHKARPECKIVAQLEAGYIDAGPSSIPTRFSDKPMRALLLEEIEQIISCFVDGIVDVKECGFDGAQLHAAHGGLLSQFLSPYTNRRRDRFGGTPRKRSYIVREIIAGARERVGDFPILIKMNCTDYLPGGVDIKNLGWGGRN